jgi:hypothetical protein
VQLIFLLDIAIGDHVLNSARIFVEAILYLTMAYNVRSGESRQYIICIEISTWSQSAEDCRS